MLTGTTAELASACAEMAAYCSDVAQVAMRLVCCIGLLRNREQELEDGGQEEEVQGRVRQYVVAPLHIVPAR